MSFFLICAVYEVFDYIKTMQKCVHYTNSIKHNTSIIAERRERSERSEANNRVLFEIPRYLYIYIYIYIIIYIYMGPFTWPRETGLALSHAHLNWFQNVLKPV